MTFVRGISLLLGTIAPTIDLKLQSKLIKSFEWIKDTVLKSVIQCCFAGKKQKNMPIVEMRGIFNKFLDFFCTGI